MINAVRYWKTKEDFENQKPEQGMLHCKNLQVTVPPEGPTWPDAQPIRGLPNIETFDIDKFVQLRIQILSKFKKTTINVKDFKPTRTWWSCLMLSR